MQGSTGKMGRGGGGSAGKRTIHTPPINRAVSAGRLSKGGGPRGRLGASSASISCPPTTSLQVEENFSLVRENPLNFGMAIKLTPNLVEEIKRVEAQGGSASIKFDAHSNNPNGNVIRVGDKSFRFTWSREPGDLCDIYEECGNGENGDGLLIESGGTWRKLNVERELDESTKNHVKRRSEEAEQKLKSRKAIVLDPQNPSMKNQMKAIAAAESNPWRNFKSRKEPPSKKQKFEPPAGGLPLSVSKSGSSATPFSKGNLSSGSPLPSHQERHCPSTSPAGSGHHVRGYAGASEALHTQSVNKTSSSDRETHNRLQNGNAHEIFQHNGSIETKTSDLRGLMISLLLEHHDKGMLFKDLERAVGDGFPNSARQILPILKQIAICQGSGRYFLKPGVEMESSNKLSSQSQSSPAPNPQSTPELQKASKLSSPDTVGAATRSQAKDALGVIPAYTTEDVEKIDILGNSPEHSNEKKVSNNDDGMASGTDTGSDTDSDTDSSESDSESGSHSKSKSISHCSTDTSSKQASDEEVDIITRDDDREPLHKLYDSGAASLKSPVDIGDYGRHDAFISDEIEIEKDILQGGDDAKRQAAHYLFHNEEGEENFEQIQSSADHHTQDRGQSWGKNANRDRDFELGGSYKYNQPGESKRQFDDIHSEENTLNKKRLKSNSSSHPVSGTLNSIFGDSPSNSSPDSPVESPDRGITNLTANNSMQNCINGPILQPDYNQVIPNLFMSDTHQAGQRSSEAWKLTEGHSERKKPGKNEENIQFVGDAGDKQLVLPGKANVSGSHTCSYPVHSPKIHNSIRSPVIDGQPHVLRRELSDLELGELRETTYDETPVVQKQFERKSPFKHLEKNGMEESGISAIVDPPSKRKATGEYANHMKPLHKGSRPMQKQHQSWGEHVDVGSQQLNLSSKEKSDELGINLGATTMVHGNSVRKVSTDSVSQNHGTVPISGSQIVKEKKRQRPDTSLLNGKQKSVSIAGTNEAGGEMKESLDEIARLYFKYEKAEPELKGPIKDSSQYQDYVKEYQEKYESYSSLHKILGSYSNKFGKLQTEHLACKDQDTKNCDRILKQVVSLYHQCGESVKRLKKIFVLLHVELQHLKEMIKDFAASHSNT